MGNIPIFTILLERLAFNKEIRKKPKNTFKRPLKWIHLYNFPMKILQKYIKTKKIMTKQSDGTINS